MNAKKGKYTLYANVSRNYMTWFNAFNETQELYEGSNLVETRKNIGKALGNGNSWSSKVAFDYDFSKNTSVGLQYKVLCRIIFLKERLTKVSPTAHREAETAKAHRG